MRPSLLIAGREFIENARTRGFWVGLFVFPALWMLASQFGGYLARKPTPTRHFVLVDQTGQFEAPLTNHFFRAEQRRVLQAVQDYATRYLRNPAEGTLIFQSAAANQFLKSGQTTELLQSISAGLRSNAPPFVPPKPRYQRVPLPDGILSTDALTNLNQKLRPWLRGEQPLAGLEPQATLFAAVLVPAELKDWPERSAQALRADSTNRSAAVPERRGIEYWSENQGDPTLRTELESALKAEVWRRQLVAAHLDYELISRIEGEQLPVTAYNPQKSLGQERVGLADSIRQFAPAAFMYLLWVAIFAISQMLLNSLIEEKSNRIIEVLLSSVTPGELMAGKLLGVAATGLVMVGFWILSLLALIFYFAARIESPALAAAQSAAAGEGPAQFSVEVLTVLQTTWLLPAFLLYFLLGYLLYAVCILALGSTCNTLKETQSYMSVIVLALMLPLISIPFIARDPNGTLATTLSWIPPYTPFVMMMRVTANPPLFDVLGTLALLVAFTVFMVWVSARIFRIGILRTGQPPRLWELIRWLRG